MHRSVTRPTVRFGPFEADFSEGVLLRRGLPLSIQTKPFTLLQILVKKPGQIVSRGELRAGLWDEDVFVDFDKNLSTTMNKLRVVLHDCAASPEYIETVPRRGYRFIAKVETESEDEPRVQSESEAPAGVAEPVRGGPSRQRSWAIAAGVFALTVFCGVSAWRSRLGRTSREG